MLDHDVNNLLFEYHLKRLRWQVLQVSTYLTYCSLTNIFYGLGGERADKSQGRVARITGFWAIERKMNKTGMTTSKTVMCENVCIDIRNENVSFDIYKC